MDISKLSFDVIKKILANEKYYTTFEEAVNDNIIEVLDADKGYYVRQDPVYIDGVLYYVEVVVVIHESQGWYSTPYSVRYVRETKDALQEMLISMGIFVDDDEELNNIKTYAHDVDTIYQYLKLKPTGVYNLIDAGYDKEIVYKVYDYINLNYNPSVPFDISYVGNTGAKQTDYTCIPAIIYDTLRYFNSFDYATQSDLITVTSPFKLLINDERVADYFENCYKFVFDIQGSGRVGNNTYFTVVEIYGVYNDEGTIRQKSLQWWNWQDSSTRNFDNAIQTETAHNFLDARKIDYDLQRTGHPWKRIQTDSDLYDFEPLVYEVIDDYVYPDANKDIDENYPDWPDVDIVPDLPIKPVNPYNLIEPIDEPQPNRWKPVSILPPIPTPNPPIPPIPPVPPVDVKWNTTIPVPSLGADEVGLFRVYHCFKSGSTDTLTALSDELWTNNVIDRLERMFKNNPMDAIISVHNIYCNDTNDGETITGGHNITLGTLKMNAKAAWVTERITTLDCGSVEVPRFTEDVRDYMIKLNLYLPFIGFREIDINDCIGGNLHVVYIIDVWTGKCLCEVRCNKDGLEDDKILYVFDGDCSQPIPLTGSDRSRFLTSAIGAVGSVALTALTGGSGAAIAGAAGSGGLSLIGNAQASIMKSGSIGGNVGALGFKKPYLVISYVKPYDAYNYDNYYGYPSNATVKVGTLKGFTQFKKVHVDTLANATEEEKKNIEQMLLDGVIL